MSCIIILWNIIINCITGIKREEIYADQKRKSSGNTLR